MSADRNSENVFDFDNPDYYINATVGFDKKKKKNATVGFVWSFCWKSLSATTMSLARF
jgi:hypothetical protein